MVPYVFDKKIGLSSYYFHLGYFYCSLALNIKKLLATLKTNEKKLAQRYS